MVKVFPETETLDTLLKNPSPSSPTKISFARISGGVPVNVIL